MVQAYGRISTHSINDGSVDVKNYIDCNTLFFAPGQYGMIFRRQTKMYLIQLCVSMRMTWIL
jgi:hypothetical protein